MFPPMPPVDPVLVLADEADDDVELRELCTLARRVGTPVVVRCAHRRAAGELIHIARDHCPRAILITSSSVNDRISAEVAVGLEAAIVTDVTDLSFNDDHLVAISDRVSSEIHTQTAVITVRPRIHEPQRDLMLTEADVVVAGGRGVGSADGFSLLARVAYALGGCLGGTHTAGELGWCPQHARISLPGAQIRPRLYLAGGVSGSVRHRSAIRGAQTVVAIDSDPAAPILREADFGIVGDLHQILPALLDELAARAAPSPESGFPESSPPTASPDLPPESASPELSAESAAPDLPPESASSKTSPPTATPDPSSKSALSVTSMSELAEA
jgi:electron transfer flavoprotein alpha subunit